MIYPTYYKKANRCLKRDSETTAIEVQIPYQNESLPVVHHKVTFPSKQRLDEEVANMEEIKMEEFEDYLSMLFKAMEINRKRYNKMRQDRYDKLYAHIPKPAHLSGSTDWKGWNHHTKTNGL